MAFGRSNTILIVAKISYQLDNWFGNCQGGPKLYTHTHTHTHARTHARMHARTHACMHVRTLEFTSLSRYVGFVVDEMESRQVFHRVSSVFHLPQISFYHFSTLIHLISSDSVMVLDALETSVICYSQTFNKATSQRLIT